MPTYVFENINTGHRWEEILSITEMQLFRDANEGLIKTVPQSPMIVTGVNLQGKTDDGWNEVMQRVAENNPYSAHADKYGPKDTKSVANREIVKKHMQPNGQQYFKDKIE